MDRVQDENPRHEPDIPPELQPEARRMGQNSDESYVRTRESGGAETASCPLGPYDFQGNVREPVA
jgi:hypothetical protein